MTVEQTLILLFNDQILDHVSIDSRSLNNSEKTVFFALQGPNHNGHDYIDSMINYRVHYFVIDKTYYFDYPDAIFFKVDNVLQTLQNFAASYRKLFNIPIIGITGSNGKTIVKEWLYYLLSPDYLVAKNPKSYNSQVGVPLSVLGIQPHHEIGIFEAGISTYNEMANLQKIIHPTIGVFTNIGSAHDVGFNNMLDKIKEKLLLFSHTDVLILQKNKSIEALIPTTKNTFCWSFKDQSADVHILKRKLKQKTILNITYGTKCFQVNIPFTDEGSIQNAINCLMVMLYLAYDTETIQERFGDLYPIEMRLIVKEGIHQTSIIDDSYSSDISSLKIALDFMESQKKYTTKTVILSDILQSGVDEKELYKTIANLLLKNKISRVIAIGEQISEYKRLFSNCITFKNVTEFLDQFQELTFFQEMILIKGAREYKLEQIVAVLEQKTHETVLEINLNAISNNLQYYKSKLLPTTKIMVMVKAFSYGNGGYEIAKLLEHHHVDYLGVAFADEGIALKEKGIQIPVMVLNPEMSSFESIIQYQLEPEIYNFNGFHKLLKILKEKNINHFPIHIKIDTGMHRLGFEAQDIPQLILELNQTKRFYVKSVLSHLAAADDMQHREFTLNQITTFETLSMQLIEGISKHQKNIPFRHLLNTSGIDNYPEAQYDMVRLGIGLYGISNQHKPNQYLERIGTLKSVISQIKNIPKGDSVGYGRKFIAKTDLKIATIPIGYADGISRLWGNEVGYVMIRQQKATIVGSICMDMLMVDVTDITCQEGNEVIVIGQQPSLNDIAKATQTIPYEVLTNISPRVKRIFYRE